MTSPSSHTTELSGSDEASTSPSRRGLWRWLLPAVFVSLGIRIWSLVELSDSFLFQPLLLDHDYYWTWATEIAGGQLVGDNTFEMDPGYAYWLGLWIAIFGENLWVPRILHLVHAALAVIGCGLLAYELIPGSEDASPIDRCRRAGHAALVMAVFPVTLFYDLQVMKTSMMTAVLPWAVWLAWRSSTSTGKWLSVAAGLVFAVACTIRGNLLPLLPVFAFLASGVEIRRLKASLSQPMLRRRLAAFLLGTTCVIAFPVIHNRLAGNTHTLLTTGGGEVFYLGTFAEGGGEYVKLPFVRPHPRLEHDDFRKEAERQSGRTLDRAESSKFWWRAGWHRISEDPLRWVKLQARKALLLVSAFELPDSASFYFWAGVITPLGLVGPFHFGVLFPLALAGLVALVLRHRRFRLSLAVISGCYLGIFLLFFVYSRFRAPVIPLLIPLAVAGVAEMRHALRSQRRVAVASIFVLLISALIVGQPTSADPHDELGLQYTNYGSWYAAQGERSAAAALFEQGHSLGNVDAAAMLGRMWLDEPARAAAGRQLITEAVRQAPTAPLPLESYITLLYRYDRIDAADQAMRSKLLDGEARVRLRAEREAALAKQVHASPMPPKTVR